MRAQQELTRSDTTLPPAKDSPFSLGEKVGMRGNKTTHNHPIQKQTMKTTIALLLTLILACAQPLGCD
ncbi:hypothetical protein BH20VER2_BH20VER2_17470 [soil metagenome]